MRKGTQKTVFEASLISSEYNESWDRRLANQRRKTENRIGEQVN